MNDKTRAILTFSSFIFNKDGKYGKIRRMTVRIFLKGLSAMMECASKENNNGKEDKIFVEICLMG